ncbi:MAG: rhomboid family intramembrane serine protease [Woeseiaceae bacterium]
MNQTAYRRQSGSSIPNVIFGLLIANGLVFVLQQTNAEFLYINFALWPATDPRSPFMPWQILTYGFLHGSTSHIFFNMFALWMFGREIELHMGSRRFLTYYFVCVAGAGTVQLIVAALQGGLYPTVGASGGVFGILLAYGLTFPNRIVVPLFPPIPMRAITFVILFGLLELYLGFSGGAPGVANFAHLGGMLFGFMMLRYWRKRR